LASIRKSVPAGRWLSNHTEQHDYNHYNALVTNVNVDKSGSGKKQTFDSYEFKTDWNGSTNYMRTSKGDISSTNRTSGLRLFTSEKIGKDRYLWYQYWDASSKGPWNKNVVGYTGLWWHDDRQYHPRLEMVAFHYMDVNKNRTKDMTVDINLHGGYNSDNRYWQYGETGQHTSQVHWHIAYALHPRRRREVVDNGYVLHGMSLQFKYRTAAGSGNPNAYFFNFKPIIGDTSGNLNSISASSASSGKGQILYSRENTGLKSGDRFRIT